MVGPRGDEGGALHRSGDSAGQPQQKAGEDRNGKGRCGDSKTKEKRATTGSEDDGALARTALL